MFALINPSRVATPSLTTGTSRGATVVTKTSGAGGRACGDLREQAVMLIAKMDTVTVRIRDVFILKCGGTNLSEPETDQKNGEKRRYRKPRNEHNLEPH